MQNTQGEVQLHALVATHVFHTFDFRLQRTRGTGLRRGFGKARILCFVDGNLVSSGMAERRIDAI